MSATLARLLPRPEERDALRNILALLALPWLAFLVLGLLDARTYYLDLPVRTQGGAVLGLAVNPGDASGLQDLPAVTVLASTRPQAVRFQIAPGRLQPWVLHAGARAEVAVGAAEIHCAADELLGLERTYATFRPADFLAPAGAANPPPRRDGLRALVTMPGTSEAALSLPPPGPLVLGFDWAGFALAASVALAEYVLTAAGALLAWRRLRAWAPVCRRIGSLPAASERLWRHSLNLVRSHPSAAIWVAAALGVAVSCYPVIFFGKSFVSPNVGTNLLYDRFPTLPGYSDGSTGEAQGADVLATMSSFVPYALVQRHALLAEHELPLFDRYNQCGLPLLAQGQTMIGDPLHVLMLLAGANAWAWDWRFLVTRLLFAAGVGLIVRLTTRQTAVALLLTFSSCFLSFFTYRLNHPTYFCLCYAPWLLYAWLHLPAAKHWREAAPWLGLLLLADWMELNSGPIKDAYLLTISGNLCGVLVLLLSTGQPWRRRWRVLGLALWCELGLILADNPFWVTPLDMIVHSWNIYLTPRLWQIQPSLLIGFFDDIFYRQFVAGEGVMAPGTNFVVFLGIAFAVSYGKTLLRDRTFLAVSLCALAAFAITFGVIPPGLIERIPFLGNVLHIDDVFSTILIVPAIVLAGYGMAECRRRFADPLWHFDYVAALAVPAFLGALFLGTTQAEQRSTIHNLDYHQQVTKSYFFWCDAVAISLAFAALPLLLRQLSRRDGRSKWGLSLWVAVCLAEMLWRHGQQLHFAPALDAYVSRPQVRVDFYARSPAVDLLHRELGAPARVAGLQDNLYPGVSGMFGLEGITGSDAMLTPAYHRLLAAQLPFAWGWRPIIDKGTVRRFKATFDLLNVRYYLGAPGGHAIDLPGISRVAKLDLDVFESREAWPRAFYTDVLSTCAGPQDFLAQVNRNDGRPFAAREASGPTASLPPGAATLPADQGARTVVPATNYRLTNNRTTFEVRAPGPGVVVLTEVYDGDNKQVTVNGRPAAHSLVNAAFEGIYLDRAGTYTVSVRSWPRYLTAGLYVAALGVLLLLGTGMVVYWPPKRRGPGPVRPSAPELAAAQI